MALLDAYVYVSTRVGADPVKTIFLFGPDRASSSRVDAAAFAERSGWLAQVEEDAAVLVAPVAPEGWDAVPAGAAKELYQALRGSFKIPAGGGVDGRGGNAWAWETLIYLVGYAEGAAFVGEEIAAHPNFAVASILVDGRARSLGALDAPSDHWLVPAPADYACRNRDVPVSLWLMGAETDGGAMCAAFREVNGATRATTTAVDGYDLQVFENPAAPAARILVSPGLSGANGDIAALGMHGYFNHVMRWKNGPDGELALRYSKNEFFENGVFEHGAVEGPAGRYHYAVHLPAGMAREEARGLPLVLSVHGRGEPAWLFSYKNGWEDLADETRGFAVLLPDSPGNKWIYERDAAPFLAIVDAALEEYGFDAGRVYLTGFSNGALFTGQLGTAHPERFAAASPWNSPGERALVQDALGAFAYSPDFADAGCELPFWVVYGDQDNKAPAVREEGFDQVLAANGCAPEPTEVWDGANRYTAAAGYAQGGRLSTQVFTNARGVPMAGFTLMKNMPHGAIADEARAAWAFMKRFRRAGGAKKVEVIG